MREGPFGMATDGSNDAGEKQFPVVITTSDLENGVQVRLLSVPVLHFQRATGENIYKLVSGAVDKTGAPWRNCLSFGTDNTACMVGKDNGVIAFLRRNKHDKIFLAGCPIHLIHIAAKKGADELPFTLDEILTDVFYYFDKASLRLSKLDQWQTLYEIEHTKILKHVATRWLSIGVCVNRLLENWYPFLSLFRDAVNDLPATNTNDDCRERRMLRFFQSPTNRLYCHFLSNIIKVFDEVNTRLQHEAPLVHCLRRDLHKLLRDLLLRYKLPDALRGREVTQVNPSTERGQRSNEDLFIGEAAKQFIRQKAENHLRDSRIKQFYEVVRNFLVAACTYIKNKLPLDNPVLKHAEVADVTLREHGVKTADLSFFLTEYPCLLPPGVSMEEIELEFADYQSLSKEEVPNVNLLRMDATWVEIGKMVDGTGVARFKNLAKVMLGILTIPHSNASCERVFSAVRQNKTWSRSSLSSDTIEALLMVKSKEGTVTDGSRTYSDERLKNLKSCYYEQLKKK